MNVISVGAGGGSIAWLDRQGMLHVGPQSAEAVPGPKGPALWKGRYRSIVDFEQHLARGGTKVVKIFLQPEARLDTANAQVGAASEFMLRSLPPGTLPPEIINFSASSVPVDWTCCTMLPWESGTWLTVALSSGLPYL